MSSVIADGNRKRKQSHSLGYQSFARTGFGINLRGTFDENIGLIIKECMEGLPKKFQHRLLLWDEISKYTVPIYIITEKLKSSSPSPFCDHCKYAGWGGHLVSKRRYHLIVPMGDNWGDSVDDEFLQMKNHSLHGLFHGNGYGHLLSINGIEAGSNHFSGRDSMNLFDRICTDLKTRKISIADVSTKKSLDLRLLFGIAYGRPWFGNWEYKFLRGSFGVTVETYNMAIKALSLQRLEDTLQFLNNPDIEKTISRYKDMSDTPLVTLQDLLSFMLMVKCCPLRSRKPTAKGKGTKLKKEKYCGTCKTCGWAVYKDFISVYTALREAYSNSVTVADNDVTSILDSKHFVKEWQLTELPEKTLTYICNLKLKVGEVESLLPGVVLQVPEQSTLGKLKEVAGTSIKDTYFMKEQFMVTEIHPFEEMEDGDLLPGLANSDKEISVTVMEAHLKAKLKFQAGAHNRRVKCQCGVIDEDGEKMVECLKCHVWQHNRCNNLSDDEKQHRFTCSACPVDVSSPEDSVSDSLEDR